jgi:hypothetical protein
LLSGAKCPANPEKQDENKPAFLAHLNLHRWSNLKEERWI